MLGSSYKAGMFMHSCMTTAHKLEPLHIPIGYLNIYNKHKQYACCCAVEPCVEEMLMMY